MTAATFRSRELARVAAQQRRESLTQISRDYATFLGGNHKGWIKNEMQLPHSKEQIAEALLFRIANAKSKNECELFCVLLISLSDFQDIGDRDYVEIPQLDSFRQNSRYDIDAAAKYILEIMESTELARKNIEHDLELFKVWIEKAKNVNEYIWPFYKIWIEKIRPSNIYRKIPAEYIDFPD